MKRLNMLLCVSVVSLSLGLSSCTTSLQAKADKTLLTEQKAIDKVIKGNPHFPDKVGSKNILKL